MTDYLSSIWRRDFNFGQGKVKNGLLGFRTLERNTSTNSSQVDCLTNIEMKLKTYPRIFYKDANGKKPLRFIQAYGTTFEFKYDEYGDIILQEL